MQRIAHPRFLLYSHDSWGLGHLRRSLAIAHALNRALPDSSTVIATGSPNATAFPLNQGIDVIKLPSVMKDSTGAYQARQLNDHYESVIRLRSALLLSAFLEFKPDVLIVDHQLLGLSREALPLLQRAKESGTYCIYGMRDVLDSIDATEAGWGSAECRWAMQEGYDEIWVYGDEKHFPTAQYYPSLSSTNIPLLYTGLITNGNLNITERPSEKPHLLATIGGGEDGGKLLSTYLKGMQNQPHRWDSTIVTGPMLRDEEHAKVMQLASQVPGTTVHTFHDSIPGLMHSCDLVLSMAGYNTCAELVASARPAVLVPRTEPRREQFIRAKYLEDSGIAKCLVAPKPEELYRQLEYRLFNPPKITRFPQTNGLEVVSARCTQVALARHAGLGTKLRSVKP